VFSLESSFGCTSPILGEIGGNLTDRAEDHKADLGSVSLIAQGSNSLPTLFVSNN
jgi:hypothetical protein